MHKSDTSTSPVFPRPPQCLSGDRPSDTVRPQPMRRYRSACTFRMSAGQRLLM